MTKNHIIAKAMLTTLGIYAAVKFVVSLAYTPVEPQNGWGMFLFVSLKCLAIFIAFQILVFNNGTLASKIIGPQNYTEDFDQRNYLIKAFRIGFVILGLLLLCSSRTILDIIRLLQTLSGPSIRMWITDVIETKWITGDLSSRYTWPYIIAFIKLVVITYLLCGGSHIIRWHLKSSPINQVSEGLKNE